MIQVKICGLSTPDAVDAAVRYGASHIGFVFYPKSPRNVTFAQAAALAARASGRAKIVGLFVDPQPDFIDAARNDVPLDIVQLHGSEPPLRVGEIAQRTGLETWKAISIRTGEDLKGPSRYVGTAQRLLYDAKPSTDGGLPGGTGHRFDWKLLVGLSHPLPWVLAGGLTATNLSDAVRTTGARMIDVSSGIESAPGVKEVDKIAAFLHAAQQL